MFFRCARTIGLLRVDFVPTICPAFRVAGKKCTADGRASAFRSSSSSSACAVLSREHGCLSKVRWLQGIFLTAGIVCGTGTRSPCRSHAVPSQPRDQPAAAACRCRRRAVPPPCHAGPCYGAAAVGWCVGWCVGARPAGRPIWMHACTHSRTSARV